MDEQGTCELLISENRGAVANLVNSERTI